MDPALPATLSPDHYKRLAWFREHEKEQGPRPSSLDGLPLVHPRRGILKSADLPYALSITMRLESPHLDRLVRRPDDSWCLSYHQESADPANGDEYTNRGLAQCMDDRVPVGVLLQREVAGRQRQYEVLGLALPVRRDSGYFFFEGVGSHGVRAGDTVSDVLRATAEDEVWPEDAAPAPGDDYDTRLRAYQQIVARQGQPGFRSALLKAYAGRCAVTDCDVQEVLEAAHLRPYRRAESNTVRNGLLLRADIHTLLDHHLLAFEPGSRQVVVSIRLQGTQYESLTSLRLAEPVMPGQRPAMEVLQRVWQDFNEDEEMHTCLTLPDP